MKPSLIQKPLWILLLSGIAANLAPAQVFNPGNLPPPTNSPQAPAQPAAPGKAGGGGGQNNQWLGNDVPFLDPSSEIATWNGKAWNITDNRFVRGRFEKYLASPEDNGPADQEYRATMRRCISLLTPKTGALPDLPGAVSLLSILAEYPIDARHCDAIAGAIYTVWGVKKNEAALVAANKRLMKEIDDLSLRVEAGARSTPLSERAPVTPGRVSSNGGPGGNAGGGGGTGGGNRGGQNGQTLSNQVTEFSRLGIDMKKIMEREVLRGANQAKAGLTEIKAKVEFQGLIIQLFLQRRFEHVLIACRCYNELFSGHERELQIKQGSDVEKMFAKGLGVNPTISTLEVFANDAMRDVDEGVQAFEYHMTKSELQTGSERLMEAFALGEYMPRVRTLPRSVKERVLGFVRDSNMLISSMEMRDFGRAEENLTRLRGSSTDFDESKFRAGIEQGKNGSNMKITEARMAAANRDNKKMEEAIGEAAKAWPTNPELTTFSKMVSEEGTVQARILQDFDSLLAQKNYRQIHKDAVKYGAVMLTNPEKQAQLKEVIDIVSQSEKAAIKADELAAAKNIHAAWESVHEGLKTLPDDAELARRSAEFSTKVSTFAEALDKAWTFEEKRQYGIGLAWFLKAKQIYPASRYAEEGISRMSEKILPDGSNLSLPPPTNASSPAALDFPGVTAPTTATNNSAGGASGDGGSP